MDVTQFIGTHEGTIRLSVFLGLVFVLGLSEWAKPRRKRVLSQGQRWFTNFAIAILDSVIVRLLFPAAAVGVALWAQANGYGLFNVLQVPLWLSILISFVVLDFAVWLSHLLSHKVPVFWRFHRMHHSDRDLDVSSALRFHPVEIVGSMLWKVAWVVALGAPAVAVILFEIVLNGTAIFNHANLKLPLAVDRILRLLVVTPDMHRVHHSIIHTETDSNYGFNLPWWDRLFGTYTDQPSLGHEGMTVGLEEWQDSQPANLVWTLKVPLLALESGDQKSAINKG